MPKFRPTVSIISVNYNQLDVTCQMLDSIRKLSYQPLQIILVDNASKESPRLYLKEHYPEVIFIQSDTNLGFSGGNNLAMTAATGDYFFLVNNDTELIEGSIETLLDLFEKNPKIGIASPLICYHPDQHQHAKDLIQYAGSTTVNAYTGRNSTVGSHLLDEGQFKIAKPTAYTHGAAMMIPNKVVTEVGNMPEAFFLYYEELDWCEQIRNAGYQVYVEPRARIYHKESISVGQMSTLKTYYLNRNRIFFMRRNRKGFGLLLFALFSFFVMIPKNTLVFLWKGQFDHLKAFYKAIWWNLLQKDKTFQGLEAKSTRMTTNQTSS